MRNRRTAHIEQRNREEKIVRGEHSAAENQRMAEREQGNTTACTVSEYGATPTVPTTSIPRRQPCFGLHGRARRRLGAATGLKKPRSLGGSSKERAKKTFAIKNGVLTPPPKAHKNTLAERRVPTCDRSWQCHPRWLVFGMLKRVPGPFKTVIPYSKSAKNHGLSIVASETPLRSTLKRLGAPMRPAVWSKRASKGGAPWYGKQSTQGARTPF